MNESYFFDSIEIQKFNPGILYTERSGIKQSY